MRIVIVTGCSVWIVTIFLTVCTGTGSKIILNVGVDVKEKPKAQMNKAQRDYLRIKLTETTRRLSRECGVYLQNKQPKEVTEALDIVQAWNVAKGEARETFEGELGCLAERAREAILFGTKEQFDILHTIVERLCMPAIMVDRVKRGKR